MTDLDAPWRRACLPTTATLGETIQNLNDVGCKIVLCITNDGSLYGSVSDGDVRRGLLRGLSLQSPISEVANRSPLVVPDGTDGQLVRAIMHANKVQQVPVLDLNNKVVGLHLWDELDAKPKHEFPMIIMAGGNGTRLRPYTNSCPKPLLPVAGKPMLEHIIERAKSQGFTRFILSINYLGDMVRNYFEDGSRLGVHVSYLVESEPLGTAGALSLIDPIPQTPFVVTNGDVLTNMDYTALIAFRARNHAHGVMAVRSYEWTNPFGVVQMDGIDVIGFAEKPVTRSYINAGVYAFLPEALGCLERNQYCDMPTFFDRLRMAGHRTVAFPMHEKWLDVGRPDDFHRANKDFSNEISE